VLKEHPDVRVDARAFKMSKSRGNVVNPDDIIEAYGADSLRLYEMFMGPLEATKPWSTRSVEGVHRFLARAYRLMVSGDDAPPVTDVEPGRDQLRTLHTTIRRVTDDIEGLRFNTAISAMMEFVNAAYKWEAMPRSVARDFALLLSPFAPHLGEEAWRALGGTDTLAFEPWPADEGLLAADTVEIAVQVNGKLRGSVTVPAGAPRDEVLAAARGHENVARFLNGGHTVRKEVVVPGRLVNFVVG
jgi:leucyl-tRNA synthetase